MFTSVWAQHIRSMVGSDIVEVKVGLLNPVSVANSHCHPLAYLLPYYKLTLVRRNRSVDSRREQCEPIAIAPSWFGNFRRGNHDLSMLEVRVEAVARWVRDYLLSFPDLLEEAVDFDEFYLDLFALLSELFLQVLAKTSCTFLKLCNGGFCGLSFKGGVFAGKLFQKGLHEGVESVIRQLLLSE